MLSSANFGTQCQKQHPQKITNLLIAFFQLKKHMLGEGERKKRSHINDLDINKYHVHLITFVI